MLFESPQQRLLREQRERYPFAISYSHTYTLWYQVGSIGVLAGLFILCSPMGIAVYTLLTGRGLPGFTLLVMLFGGIIVMLFLVATSTMLLINRKGRQRGRQLAHVLDQQGILTDGVVIDRWFSYDNDGASDYSSSYLAYRYGSYEIKQIVSSWTYLRTRIGARVRVRYLPSNPHIAHLEDRR
jgi:hypothetical protein